MDKFSFFIDRGGTFTDVYAQVPGEERCVARAFPALRPRLTRDGSFRVLKLLSEDPANYQDAPTEGIRRILEEVTGEPHPKGKPLDTSRIQCIRMGTTVATNALLERRGEPCVLVTTRGFRDLLRIGNQSRPCIFDLEIRRPDVLFSSVIEVDERLTLRKEAETPGEVVEGSTGQELVVERPLDEAGARAALQSAFDAGVRSVAIVLLHGYLVDRHERRLGAMAREIGFPQVSLSSEVMPMVKMVPRGFTTCADAYLSPRIAAYLDSFCAGFDDSLRSRVQLHFMQSDGGLAPIGAFSGHKAVLSGPAGGVVGYARTTAIPADDEDVAAGRTFEQVIGFDMGGTSTDCSRFAGAYEHVYETTTAGVTIQAPQLDISTVAAGGGSRLFFRSGLFLVGPESVGAHPGPVCYRKGGHLAVTDANLVLGRIVPEFFPAIFGPNEDQPLDRDGAFRAFQDLAEEVNAHSRKRNEHGEQSAEPHAPEKSVAEVAHGFLRVANEAMCRPIRELTQMKGFDITTHALACFGGAGGQHACAIARALGMRKIFIHRFSGILSAYGMGLADVTKEEQEPAAETLEEASAERLGTRLAALSARVRAQLEEQGFAPSRVSVQHYLNLRYQGTDSAVMMRGEDDSAACDAASFLRDFEERYRREFGFTLQRPVLVDDIRVRAIGLAPPVIAPQQGAPPVLATVQTFFEGGWRDTQCYRLRELGAGARVEGPAIVVDATSTILVEPGCGARVTEHGDVVISVGGGAEPEAARVSASLDPIQLSIFSHRFMGIAEQMGRTLQRTSVSVNIKERLDFSCALFGPDGGLVANAPHIPVHLGAMQESVRFQMQRWDGDLEDGDVLVSNHPQLAGGSHLPDITVMTPVFDGGKIVFWVASRGHHADIGGVAPGSMPPLSQSLAEEGAAIVALKLVRRGEFDEEGVTAALMAPATVPGCSGTRNLRDNLSDLKAQVAANRRGIALVRELIAEYGLEVVHAFMAHIQSNAEEAVRDMLREFAARRGLGLHGAVEAADHMDDGTPIRLRMQVDGTSGSAVLDFEGTGPQVLGNTNAPPAVTQSAVIYVLRCLAGRDIPLNQGCLHPIEIRIPPRSILHPSPDAAVVGGNVLTSQRVVDVVLRAFGACAASQGCMNNFTFGDASLGYYETIAGGAGAGPTWHGQSGVHTHMTNTRITDPEVLESRYPVLLRRFELRHGSGGAGRFTGGCGVVREVECRRPLTVSILSERRAFAPYGLEGGECGARGLNLVRRGDSGLVQSVGGKNSLQLSVGDAIVIHTPGGGGFGRSETSAGDQPPQQEGEEEEASYPPTRQGGGSIGKLREAEATM